MPRLRCPECRFKFNTSKEEGRVRCPECEKLFEPEWDDVRDREPRRRDDEDDDRDDRPIVKRRRKQSGGSNVGLIVVGIVVFFIFLGGVGYGVYRLVGGSPSFTTFEPPGGRCSILMPGTPTAQEQNILGMNVKMHLVERRSSSWAVAWADIPPGLPFSLRGAVDGIARSLDGTINHTESFGDVNGNGCIEFEVAIRKPNGYASGRVMVVNGRFYQVVAASSHAKLTDSDVRTFIDSFKLKDGDFPWVSGAARPQAKNTVPQPGPGPKTNPNPKKNPWKGDGWAPDPKDVTVAREQVLGTGFDEKQTDAAPAGGIMVGLEVGLAPFFDYNIVGTLKPIYRTGKTDTPGKRYGTDAKNGVVKLMAKPGYAIGALTAKTGLGIDGVSVTFMKIDGDRLNPDESYESEWVGGQGGGGPRKLTGQGKPVVGMILHESPERVSSVGLVFK